MYYATIYFMYHNVNIHTLDFNLSNEDELFVSIEEYLRLQYNVEFTEDVFYQAKEVHIVNNTYRRYWLSCDEDKFL